MYKIRKIEFLNHPILGNLKLDFCDQNNNAVDTIIFAGENGTGKSTILDEIFRIATYKVNTVQNVELENNNFIITLSYYFGLHSIDNNLIYIRDTDGTDNYIGSSVTINKYCFSGIFSDVDINFKAREITNVTSLSLDSENSSRRSTTDLPTQIKQLLIDIQSLDNDEISRAVKENPTIPFNDIDTHERMPRFTNAFNKMFHGLSYSRVDNQNNQKTILFNKFGKDISIDNLSSGEKQIVYRGCFLLKDVNALNGAFVFIDEPEISLHPTWQMKILDYYKDIFTDLNGKQTSQIFTVTHSPFVIHNENRRNDKVIVLTRDDQGNIIVKDKPEYFKCTSVEAVQDAFFIQNFSAEKPTVYLEGRTDEKYFNKAVSVFCIDIPFQFRWVGYINDNGQEENTGKDALIKASSFLIGQNLPFKNICLFDCDTNYKSSHVNNVYTLAISTYINSKKMKKGIENALILDDIDTAPFYTQKIKEGDYGDNKTINEFNKMDFCDYICNLSNEYLKKIFANLKEEIDSLVADYEEQD